MTAVDSLANRVEELEQRARRFKLADSGAAGWENYFQSLILAERDYWNEFLTAVVASVERDLRDEMKAMLDQALAVRVRGTFQPGTKYERGDVVALDGASFLARKDGADKCPGPDWQLMAMRGARGVAGPQGERGPSGRSIVGWIVDRSCYRVTPKMNDGTLGAAIELRALFEPEDNTAA